MNTHKYVLAAIFSLATAAYVSARATRSQS